MAIAGQKRKRATSENILPTPQPRHPYLTGNFAPIKQTIPLTPCTFTGRIPDELAGGEYVRNGSNPVSNDDLGRDAHWFDGDGMLAGVYFTKKEATGEIRPEFVNQFILTDLYLSTLASPRLKKPILPSIATLVNPVASFLWVTFCIMRTIFLVILSHLPGSRQPIKKISVANTNVVYHDGRALATCESGPPMRIQLPGLETVGWFNGVRAEGEPASKQDVDESVLGGDGGLISFMREWTTAHPKVDPISNEMLMFHSSFAPPYVQYSVLPQTKSSNIAEDTSLSPAQNCKIVNAPVPGISGARMMHDFGVSLTHTIIMDLPLSLDPLNSIKGRPPVSYDSSKPSRFGVFPRRDPTQVQWFETDASCIFHTANSWDDLDDCGEPVAVNMLACRLTSATLVFAAGNIAAPVEKPKSVATIKQRMPFFSKYDQDKEDAIFDRNSSLESSSMEKEALLRLSDDVENESLDELFSEDQCRLYYYNFDLLTKEITQQWALSAIPFEFPSVRSDVEMQQARYIYGCSTTTTSFGAALGKATKIDALVKIDAATLIARGRAAPPPSVTGVVDSRTMTQILAADDPADPIRVFRMPEGWYAQEPRFVPACRNTTSPDSTTTSNQEDDGYLLFYAFDESQLTATGDVPADDGSAGPAAPPAQSELWILDARGMRDIVARVRLPQRVPYGLHGAWFDAAQIGAQREVEVVRSTTAVSGKVGEDGSGEGGVWMAVRDRIETMLG